MIDNLAQGVEKFISECDASEQLAFRAALVLAAVAYAQEVQKRCQREEETAGQVSEAMRQVLRFSLKELCASLATIQGDDEELSPASPQLQLLIKQIRENADELSRITAEYLRRLEPASDKRQ